MAFNGSGVFVRLYNWVNDKNAGINITASRMDAEMDGMATALSDCVTRDGQSPATQNLPMGGFVHTNVGTGTARNQYATIAQAEDGVINWAAAGGTSDALTVSYSPSITTLIDGQLCYVRATATNLTTSPSFSPNGLTAHTVTKQGGGALNGSDWTNNTELQFRYNLANTRWEWLNASASQASTFSDSSFRIQDNGDATKQIAFEASSITTGNTRTFTAPNVSGILLTDGTNSFTSAQLRGALTDETGTGAAVFAGGNIGAATATSINFGGTTLSNYVEGTWTPSIAFGGASVGVAGTQTGSYTRIGNRVMANCTILLTNKGSSTGAMTITGLPITAAGDAGASIGLFSNFSGLTGVPMAVLSSLTSIIQLYQSSATSGTQLTNTQATNTTALYISLQYNV